MKTRSGENVPLRELLDEACNSARAILDEKNPDLSDAEKIDIAHKLESGRQYSDLSQYRMTDYVFFVGPNVLSLQGNTAPYLQSVRQDSLDLSQKRI